MNIFLLRKLIDNVAHMTEEAFRNKKKAEKRLSQLEKSNLNDNNICKYTYDIEEIELQ